MLLRTNTFRILVVAAVLCASLPASANPSLDAELKLVYRSQAADGSYSFEGLARFYQSYPVLASMALDEHQRVPNAALVSQSAASIGRYYDYLLSSHDRDRDLLVETTVVDPSGQPVDIEDPGFNSLLALDLLSLSRLELEIRRPYRALHWYLVARSIEDAVIHAGHDGDAGFFFPTSAVDDQPVKRYHTLSALPLLFTGQVGDNVASSMIREYLLTPVARVPESPYTALGGPTPEWHDDADASAQLLKTIAMLQILESRGFHGEAASFRDQALARALNQLAAIPGGQGPSAHLAHLVDLLEAGSAGALDDDTVALDLFTALVRATDSMKDAEYVRLESAVDNTRRWLSLPVDGFTTTDVNLAEKAVRTIYTAVSTIRTAIEERSLFPSEAYRAIGVDPLIAMSRVVDDVAAVAHGVDNRVFARRFHDAGVYVTPTLLRERAVAGSPVEVKWTIGVHNTPLTLSRLSTTIEGQTQELIAAETTLQPGQPLTSESTFNVGRDRIDTLQPITLTLAIETSGGESGRWHVLRSVYVEHPVSITAAFSHGRMLDRGTLPIDVVITKRFDAPVVIRYDWYSPSGLVVAEGRSGEYSMPAGQDSVALGLNVVVPSPCRPGRFPFKLKFHANDNDMGIIAANLFKPYQWLYVGPFDRGVNPMGRTYPPQRGVRVLDTYKTASGSRGWRPVGDGVYDEHGDIVMRRLTGSSGVTFLYTLIETEAETSLPVVMAATSPADLFVNGQPVLEVGRSGDADPVYARADLRRGVNAILIKVAAEASTRLSFNVGDENNPESYAFNNNLSEILDDYATLQRRGQDGAEEPSESQKLITLRYRNPDARAVAVIGTFNGWSPERSPMHSASDGTWEIVLSLPPGKYSYRFLVDNREQVLDPGNHTVEPDGFGGKNSVFVVE
jgi:hypothetical protein